MESLRSCSLWYLTITHKIKIQFGAIPEESIWGLNVGFSVNGLSVDQLMGSSLRLLEVVVSRRTRFDGSVWVVSGDLKNKKKRVQRRRCGFSFRLAWEASRSRPVMGLLTLWRSRLQLVTFLIEPFFILFSYSLSCCPSSSFSLLSLRSKVSMTALLWVLSMNLFLFLFPNLSFWLTFMC